MDSKLSIRQKQIKRVSALLDPEDSSLPVWKFIIYDSVGRDIMDSLYTHKDLRSHYVTLRLPINSIREAIPDPVSAIYFVMPTDENVEIICQDLSQQLYHSYYFNFISTLSEKNLKLIAEAAIVAKCALDVRLVQSQYLNFISVEDDFFILRETGRELIDYFAINRSDATDEEITLAIDQIVDGLFSLIVTLNVIPIIRCPKGGPAEVVSEKLTNRLRETLAADNNKEQQQQRLFDRKASKTKRRPLLCLVDRTIDMSTPLHHTWTYQALIHDLFDIKLNMITLCEETKAQLFDLNQEDKFWIEQKGSPFPQVADAVQRELDEFKKHKDDINNVAIVGIERLLKKHTTIATAVLDEIKARKLDYLFELEEKIMNRAQIDKVILDDLLSGEPEQQSAGNANDKYRLFLISYICDNPILTEDEAERYVDLLEGLGCKRATFEHIKNWKTFSKSNVVNLQTSLLSGGGGVLKTASMFTKLVSQSSQFVMSGVKNLVLKEYNLPLTKIVDNLMDTTSKQNKWSLEYRYLDPEAETNNHQPQVSQRKNFFHDAIVFVVGGGNYIEYQNLVDYCKSKSRSLYGPRNVIYGATDLTNASQFLNQLEQLGNINLND